MNNKIKLIFITILLSACVSQPESPRSNMGDLEQSTLFNTVDGLLNSQLDKKPGSSGSKKIDDPIATFYADMASCDTSSFNLKDLMVEEIRVSNHDVNTVSRSLSIMGYQVIDLKDPNAKGMDSYTCEDLPVIVIQSQSKNLKLSFDAGQERMFDDKASTKINSLGYSNAGELDSFLVYYHPDRINEIQKLKWLVGKKLDVPSAQVYIETLVLEVREEDSKEFGISYSKGSGDTLFSLGSLTSPGTDTLGWIRDTFVDPETGLQVFTPGYGKRTQLKALIEEGKAEVLSRPSVLAISNRQAVIQIVDVLQTANLSSTLSENGNLQISAYQFDPLLIGITLNLKPRVSADRKWLTLEIDATVESEDDENSGQVFAPTESGDKVLLAEKQGSSSKKVRTFARIPDRTPIIIGGLVSSSKEKSQSKIPLLGDIPLLGKLFTSTDTELVKREVIIVLTPYILAEEAIGIASNRPNPEVTNRISNSLLFENKYQIKNDDLFDLSYFHNDRIFSDYKNKAIQISKVTPHLRTQQPFKAFLDNDIPGAHHLINKMIYDIALKSGISSNLPEEKIAFIDEDGNERSLKILIDELDFVDEKTKLVAGLVDKGVVYDIVAANEIMKPSKLQLTLSDKSDIERLKNVIICRDIIALNGGYQGLMLDSLHPGKEIVMPNYSKAQVSKITAQTIEIFMDSRSYYQSLLKSIEKSYKILDDYQLSSLILSNQS